MIEDLEKLIGSCFCIERVNLFETLLIVAVLIASAFAVFNWYGVTVLVTWYLTRYFTRKAVLSDEY